MFPGPIETLRMQACNKHWSSHLIVVMRANISLTFQPLPIHSVSCTPWAEGPPSSPVGLWVSYLLLMNFLSSCFQSRCRDMFVFFLAQIHKYAVVEPSWSATLRLTVTLFIPTVAVCLSLLPFPVCHSSPPPLMIRVHLPPRNVAHRSHGRLQHALAFVNHFPLAVLKDLIYKPPPSLTPLFLCWGYMWHHRDGFLLKSSTSTLSILLWKDPSSSSSPHILVRSSLKPPCIVCPPKTMIWQLSVRERCQI